MSIVRMLPVGAQFKITSPYGRRTDPITGKPAGHDGVDFGCPVGTPIVAVADGTVYRKDIAGDGVMDGNGNAVWLDDSEYTWCYLHLSAIDSALYTVPARGKSGGSSLRVTKGQMLGLTGNTGRSTGPHLHLGCYDKNSLPVDPMPLLRGVVPYSGPRVLHLGMTGSDVVRLQQTLGVKADGDFGPITETAVRQFQAVHLLLVDGEVGPATRAVLGW